MATVVMASGADGDHGGERQSEQAKEEREEQAMPGARAIELGRLGGSQFFRQAG